MGDPTLEAKIFTAVTGLAGDELDQYAERIFNLQRAILVREGWQIPESDSIPGYNFTEPLGADPAGRELTIPGAHGEVVSTSGNVLDWQKFVDMRKEYYSLRGWNPETGLPRAETLKAIGLGDVASSFLSRGYKI